MANRASRSFSGVFRLISFVLCCEFSAFASEVTVSSLSELSAAIADASAFEATTILISPMVSSFTLSAQITLDKPITIRSAVACDVPREDMPLFTASGCRAFYLNHPEARLVGLAIKGGVATSASPSQHYGGNVLIGSLGGTLENCILDGGLGSGTGGKGLGGNLAMLGASGVVSNCVLRNGRDTTNYGGKGAGAYINAGLITHCVITNNYSWRSNADGGLGVSVLGSGVVRYSLIAHNYETGSYQPGLKGDGLGAAYVDGNGVLENCTIVDNTSGGRCAGVWCNSANGTVRNCIIAGNRTSSKSLGAEILGGKTAASTYCLSERPIAGCGEGCVVASIEAMGFESYASGDYRLSLASPAIDAAADGVTDLGCYERAEASEAEVDIVFSSPRLIAGEILTASAKVRGFESGAISYLWTFEDAPGADSQSIVHDTTGESGRQSVRVTVTQGAVSAEITRSYYVAQKDIHVSAANEIGDAIENAADGCVIWLANGNYQIDTSYYVDKGITIRSEAGELSETDVIIRRNTSKDIRPFFLNHPAAELRGLVISGGNGANDENIRGGNIIIGANGGRVINCIVQDGLGSPKNYTYCRGGNIYMAGESSLVSNCVIRNGQDASNYQGGGGGIFIDAGLVTECIITNNQCFRGNGQLDGSGVCMAGGTVANCLIAHNYEGLNNQSGRIGGAVRLLANSSALLTGCTIVKNVSRYSKVAGVIASGGTVANCIIAGNETLSDKAADAVWSGTASRFVNCLGDREIVGGVNSLAVANAAAVSFEDFDAGNYLLTYASPARNAGNNEFAVGNLDLAGNERIDDETIDIGAFEFTLGAAKVVECSADISRGLFPLEVTFTPHIAGFSAGELQCVWTFTRKVGGEVMTSGAVAAQEYTHTFTEPGYYDVELTASDGNDSASYSYENFIAVCAPDIYVVPEPSPENAVFPYATPETAGGIDDGISAAIDGCTVWIANGRYSITQGFTIANSVTIRSFSGELSETNVVIKRADGSDARPFYLAHPEAELRGLVISGGNGANNQTDKGGNVWISVEGGSLYNCIIENGILNTYTTYGGNLYVGADSSIVSNCILRGGQATGQYSGYGSGAYLAAGLITHCVITNNNGYRANGGAMGLQIAGGSAENCLIAGNYDSSTQNPAIGGALVLTGGKAVNCTIADNLASVGSYCAGVNCAAEAKVYNCIIAGNSATHASSTAADKVWRGTAENFENCVTDFEIVGGESCKLAPTQAILVNYPKFTIGRHSAALNAGNNAHSTAETDLSGCRRITHSTIDAGCYEADFEYGTSILLR